MRAAYYGLHYGKEWLKWSMRSIREHVDEIHVFYVSTPSHGTQAKIPCPETALELEEISKEFDAHWWNCPHFHWEGEHRDFAVNTLKARGADTILVVDADELWLPEHLSIALRMAEEDRYVVTRVWMRHFWRSLKWVCDDAAAPARILRPNNVVLDDAEGYSNVGRVLHMGYAQTPEIIFYKQHIHGHRAEWRDGWFEKKFLGWRPGMTDVHPTNVDFWTPKETDFEAYMQIKQLCGDHPYFDLDLIQTTGSLATFRDEEQRRP
jgi:hypothetical protein